MKGPCSPAFIYKSGRSRVFSNVKLDVLSDVQGQILPPYNAVKLYAVNSAVPIHSDSHTAGSYDEKLHCWKPKHFLRDHQSW